MQRELAPDRASVVLSEKAWLQAHLALDVDTLDHLMADEYIQVDSRGRLVDKQTVLASMAGGSRHWDTATADDLLVRLYGGTAVVIGRWRARGVNSGVAFDYSARYVGVWIWRDERWQMVSDQSTEIAI